MFILNTSNEHGQPLAPGDARSLDGAAAREVERWLALCPSHRETPLRSPPGLAREIGVGRVDIKDEASRFGLGSFKALGGAYAVIRLVLEEASTRLGRPVEPRELLDPRVRAIAATMTVACATAGNHGRSVAAGARLAGCRAVIFMHASVSDARVAAIAALGAEVRRIDSTYEVAVTEARRASAAEGWTAVSDTSWPGYERIPLLVMQGYTALVAEALRALALPPTHLFLQAGVGGFAAAVAGHIVSLDLASRPRIVVVEPERAACVPESHRAGHAATIAAGEPTVMATLDCHEPSLVAWRVLSRTATAFMTVDEDDALETVRRATSPANGDPAISTAPSGAAGLGGLLCACRDPTIRQALALDADARILLFNTEGAMT